MYLLFRNDTIEIFPDAAGILETTARAYDNPNKEQFFGQRNKSALDYFSSGSDPFQAGDYRPHPPERAIPEQSIWY